MSKIFGECDSIFHTCYKCLNIVKQVEEDFVTYIGRINLQCELSKITEIKEDMFKCLIFVQGLTTKSKKEICSRLLSLIENDTNITLQKVTEECQKLINIKRYNKSIENKGIAQIQRVKKSKSDIK